MKSRMLFGFLALAILASLIGSSSAASTNSLGVVGSAGTTYTFTLATEGDTWRPPGGYSTLTSLTDRDKFVMTLSAKLVVTVIVADCCVMGDTIAVFYPTSTAVKFSVTSPKIIVGTATLSAGTVTFWVGYTACPGGFPASYWIWVIATHA